MSQLSRQYRRLGSSPELAQDQASQGYSAISDSSDPLFTMYNDMTAEEDRKMAESWKADADGILTFTGLFSATVATLVAVSIQDLQPSPQGDSTFYLGNIYQLLADPNTPDVSTHPLLKSPPPFTPPRYAVWVNSLWFLSLAMSLTCGLLATLLQQWARRYIKITQPPYGPRKRARIRTFFAEGLEKRHMHFAVEALPILLHVSLFHFFTGLLILLFNTDRAVFGIVAGWVGVCVAMYGYITLIPIFQQDSPYCSPLSSPVWTLLNGTIFAVIRTLSSSRVHDCVGFAILGRMINLRVLYERRFLRGMVKTAEETALQTSSDIDARVLMWTFDSLDEDHELERFFAGIPGFFNSKVVSDPFGCFAESYKWRLSDALIGLMHRTLTSNLVIESMRRHRSLICTRAMHVASLSIRPSVCEEIINGGWDGLLNYIEFGHFIKRQYYDDPSMAYYSTCMVTITIATVKEREDLWHELARGHLGISTHVLQSYLAHGDSALLANYIHILREIIHVHFDQFQSGDASSRWKVLESVSQFDIQDTLPSLQHEFCNLWNEIVDMTETTSLTDHRILIVLLKNIRRAYIALHEGTDSAPIAFCASTTDDEHVLFLLPSYPLCNIPSHRPSRAPQSPLASSHRVATPTIPARQPCDLTPFPVPHNGVPSAASSSSTAQNKLEPMGHQFPSAVPSASLLGLNASAPGVSNMPVPPQPVRSSSFSGTVLPLRYTTQNPLSVMQDSSFPTCYPPVFDRVFDNAVTPCVMPQSAVPQPDDAHRSHVPIHAAAHPAASPARPASAVHRGADSY